MKPQTAETAAPERSVDAFLGGLVTLVQPRGGHRAGLDAALLQALVPANAAGLAVDLGSGVGTVAFALAARAAALNVIAVERDVELLACARAALQMPENAAFAARVELVEADVTDLRGRAALSGLAAGSADFVLMNPPFDVAGEVRQSPDDRRRAAHVGEAGTLSAWCRNAAALLKPGGMLGVIHRPQALPALIEALGRCFGDISILPAHPAKDLHASRILVRARLGRSGGLRLLPGLVLHQPGGAWTSEADAILRGREQLPL